MNQNQRRNMQIHFKEMFESATVEGIEKRSEMKQLLAEMTDFDKQKLDELTYRELKMVIKRIDELNEQKEADALIDRLRNS